MLEIRNDVTVTPESGKGNGVCLIGCWYKDDIYSHSCYNLIQELKKIKNINVRLITSNCSCFSSSQSFSCNKDELINTSCEIIRLPYAPSDPSKKYGKFRYYVTKILKLNFFLEISRGILFFRKTKGNELVHFDQVLRSFGFLSFMTFLFLAKLFKKKVVVTVHELDPIQAGHKRFNKYYNKTDKVIVHSKPFKKELVRLGVDEDKVKVIHQGVTVGEITESVRDQFSFWGGHHLSAAKGFGTLLSAWKILQAKGRGVRLVIYVGYGCGGLNEGKERVKAMDLEEYIVWSEFMSGSSLARAYQKSMGCIIPYTGGSGRHPATVAMANATPIIATRKAELPEYLGEHGIYIEEDSPEELADAVLYLMGDKGAVHSLGRSLRKRAEESFSWQVIAKKVSMIYGEVQSR